MPTLAQVKTILQEVAAPPVERGALLSHAASKRRLASRTAFTATCPGGDLLSRMMRGIGLDLPAFLQTGCLPDECEGFEAAGLAAYEAQRSHHVDARAIIQLATLATLVALPALDKAIDDIVDAITDEPHASSAAHDLPRIDANWLCTPERGIPTELHALIRSLGGCDARD